MELILNVPSPYSLAREETSGDLERLLALGARLDDVREAVSREWLRIRDKRGRLVPFVANRAQQEYARRSTQKNIVLKARQLGMTTYVASRFFLQREFFPFSIIIHHCRALGWKS